ncbi:Major facilitator superfamily domain-containing protein 1 [Porphyridium purpureum]|uniref:Lysosomal dipeptide transporter MFSD1 n=1 Tax=Porphyridium purpureum TaxID=35688 RepID=A0A5J4YIU7_PORPP|nr:Major facilitator superfamily domain-containing protein 1 [Porphyridium purpureum]|eukprot:POR5115..scf210_14
MADKAGSDTADEAGSGTESEIHRKKPVKACSLHGLPFFPSLKVKGATFKGWCVASERIRKGPRRQVHDLIREVLVNFANFALHFPAARKFGREQMMAGGVYVRAVARDVGLVMLISSLAFGAHFGKHSVSTMTSLITHAGLSRRQFGLLFSLQEAPGMVVPLLAAGLVSSLSSPALGGVVLSSVTLAGQVLCTCACDALLRASARDSVLPGNAHEAGANTHAYAWLLVGRFMFGLGDSALVVLQGTCLAYVFGSTALAVSGRASLQQRSRIRGVSLGSSYGLMIAMSRLTTMASLGAPAYIASHCALGAVCVLWVASFLCLVSVTAALVLLVWGPGVLKHWNRARQKQAEEPQHEQRLAQRGAQQASEHEEEREQHLQEGDGEEDEDEKVGLPVEHAPISPLRWITDGIAQLHTTHIIILCVWMTTSSVFFSYLHFSVDFLTTSSASSPHPISPAHAGLYSSGVLLASSCLSPLVGFVLDRFGGRPLVIMGSSALMSVALGLFLVFETHTAALAAHVLLGVAFGLAPVTLLSSMALVSPAALLPFMLAAFKVVENIGMAVMHVSVGSLVDRSHGSYTAVIAAFVGINLVGAALGGVLLLLDTSTRVSDLSPPGARDHIEIDESEPLLNQAH